MTPLTPAQKTVQTIAIVLSTSFLALVVGLLVGVNIGLGESSSGAPLVSAPPVSSTSTAPVVPGDAREPVTIEGGGALNTAPFDAEGDYRVDWATTGSCYYSATLQGEGAMKGLFSTNEAMAGSGYIYGLPASEYHVAVNTGPVPDCGWSVTLVPSG